MSSRIAAAVRFPALDSMYTTPRAIFKYLHFMRGWVLFQELGIVGDLRQIVFLDVIQRIRKCHFPEVMMMAVAFPVSGNVHQFGPISFIGKSAHHAFSKSLPIIQ